MGGPHDGRKIDVYVNTERLLLGRRLEGKGRVLYARDTEGGSLFRHVGGDDG